jgi:hypothetical protein
VVIVLDERGYLCAFRKNGTVVSLIPGQAFR